MNVRCCTECGAEFAPRKPTSRFCSKRCSGLATARKVWGNVLARFWARVQQGQPNDCWLWTGGVFQASGYGYFRFRGKGQGAHRVAYELTFGEIPDGMHVCHTCDNRICVNPLHLFLGTPADNMADKAAKGRAHRMKGEAHPLARLTEAQVFAIREQSATGVRQREIARRFGVCQQTVSIVVSRKGWRHVA